MLKLIADNTNVDFLGKKTMAFLLSGALIIASIILIFSKGLNFGVDFTGGIVIEVRPTEITELSAVRKLLTIPELGEISLQTVGDKGDIMIRLGQQENSKEGRDKAIVLVKSILNKEFGFTDINYLKTDFVGPQVGQELIEDGALSLLLAVLAIMIYIWLRFDWQFGVGAIIALFHDVILTLGLFVISGIEFNLTSIAAVLTIIGYSINDTVVIYDRVRENLRRYKKMQLHELLNISINDTLSRTILTAGTTMAALIALVWMGGDVIKGFSISVLFGVIVGTYSSIFVATPILIFMNIRGEEAIVGNHSKT